MNIEVVSFYSDIDGTTYYSDHAKRLKNQLDQLDISNDIREKPSLGSYQHNCHSKPQFIYDMLKEKEQPIIWLDVDSSVLKPLDIFQPMKYNTDIAVACSVPEKFESAKASPIYFGFNDRVMKFLSNWIRLVNNSAWFDHEPLLYLLDRICNYSDGKGFKLKFIEPNYCVWPGNENKDTVILMGLADAESKKQRLRELGHSEEIISWQSPGTK